MLIRALVVLLLVLNLGVALWWAMRPSALPNVQPTAPAAGVERLQLASEATAGKPEAPRAPDPTAAAVSQCVSLGPYADAALAEQARRALQPLAVRVALRREYTGTPRNWKVFLPPASTIQQAEAAVADHEVVLEPGPGHALGRRRRRSRVRPGRRPYPDRCATGRTGRLRTPGRCGPRGRTLEWLFCRLSSVGRATAL